VTRPGLAGTLLAALALVTTACTLATSPTPTAQLTPAVTPAPIPSATPGPTPTAAQTPTPVPTPDEASVPIFDAGAIVTTRTTVHLRDLPGTRWGISADLPPGALAQVVLGPIRTDGYGWYLVRDVDPAKPAFIEAWVAAGFSPNAFLAPASAPPSPAAGSPTFVIGFAQTTGGDFGPISVEGSTALRWAAAVPSEAAPGATCTFTGSLAPSGGTPVVFLQETVAQAPTPGTTQPTFFTQHPTLTGDLFLHVDSDCSWALTVVRLPL
jgi:hypothetical protein